MSEYLRMLKVGEKVLLMGNQAIARGAIEAGVRFGTAYPGTPSSEILETLARVAKDLNIHVEWSTNEIVAFETAAAASWSGLRAMTSMKQNGLSVILDFLFTLACSGSGKGGLILISADDPNAHSSPNEQDSRPLGKYAEVPVLEPSRHQEAKDMIAYAFEISERHRLPVLVREVTRLGHSSGVVTLGEIRGSTKKAAFDREHGFCTSSLLAVSQHNAKHEKLARIEKEFESSPWDRYEGPEKPALLVITSGMAYNYVREALKLLGIAEKVGILKLGTVFPLPKNLVMKHLKLVKEVLFAEEIDPFLEESVRSVAVDMGPDEIPRFYGKTTGSVPRCGELDTDKVMNAIVTVMKLPPISVTAEHRETPTKSDITIPKRTLTFCPGCPHRATYWSILRAIRRNKNKGIVTGDIGCYGMGRLYHGVMKTLHCMGAGAGLASGFGQLGKSGLDEPVIAMMGDSTFYHACIPALVNIIYNGASNVTLCILDNETTAMTGFQPHPGTGINAVGDPTPKISIENVVKGLGYNDVRVIDPYNIREATKVVYEAITSPGRHVIIFRRKCTLVARREAERAGVKILRYEIDQDRCGGEKCGVCFREFNCPAINSDPTTNTVIINDALCTGCGVCAKICPYKAIYRTSENDA